jgi:heat shock protein HslJ
MTTNKKIIMGLVFVLGLLSLPQITRFYRIDSCLDYGGRFNYEINKCEKNITVETIIEEKPKPIEKIPAETKLAEVNVVATSSEQAPNPAHLPLSSQWILESFSSEEANKSISKSSYINIEENLKRFTGNGGCNNIGGEIITSTDKIKFDRVMSTKMFCENMAQENLFLENLSRTNKYKIVGGELFLFEGENLLMILESFRG